MSMIDSTARIADGAVIGEGTSIGPYDVLIAGQAISRQMILVTHNVNEFRRVPGLSIEDWEA